MRATGNRRIHFRNLKGKQNVTSPNIKHLETKIPALHIPALLFHIWQAEFHVQPESVSGLDGTVRVCLTVLESFQLEVARIWPSAFPIHQTSIHKAVERIKYHRK